MSSKHGKSKCSFAQAARPQRKRFSKRFKLSTAPIYADDLVKLSDVEWFSQAMSQRQARLGLPSNTPKDARDFKKLMVQRKPM